MKALLQESDRHLLVFEVGDEVISLLKKYVVENKIKSGWVNFIGACGDLTLAYYNIETKVFEKQKFTEDLEILGVMANVSFFEGEPIIHAHGTFGRPDLSVIGGHLFDVTISATCELHLQVFKDGIDRKFDERTGLNLMHCRVTD